MNTNGSDLHSHSGGYIDRWPHIDDETLRALWLQHTPLFLKLEEPWQESIKEIRIPFLGWLESIGVSLDDLEKVTQVAEGLPWGRPGPRMKLERVDYQRQGNSARALVAVSLQGKTVEGSSTKEVAGHRVIWLPAEAVMKAARAILPVVEFEIESAFSVGSSDVSQRDIAVVVAKDPEGLVPTRFVGACEISTSEPEAGAKAALDAINRHAEIAAGFSPLTKGLGSPG